VDLADHLTTAVQRALQDLPIHERVDKANAVLALLGSADRLVAGPRQLLAVARQEHPGVWRLLQTRPRVPLSRPALLTNAGPHETQFATEPLLRSAANLRPRKPVPMPPRGLASVVA
jgi:hypothetical protein